MSDNKNRDPLTSGEDATVSGLSELQTTKSLVEMANTTFKSLCETLEMEQQKLSDLELRRKALQTEMEKLKMDIEEEKKLYHQQLNDSISGNSITSETEFKGFDENSVSTDLDKLNESSLTSSIYTSETAVVTQHEDII